MRRIKLIGGIIAISALLLGAFSLPAAAEATDKEQAEKQFIVQYEKIAERMNKHNLSLQAAALAVDEIADALGELEDYNDATRAQQAGLQDSIRETEGVIAAELEKQAAEPEGFDDTLLKQMQALLPSLQQSAAGLQYLDTGEAEKNLALAKVHMRSLRAAMIDAAQKTYLICLQLQTKEQGLLDAVAELEQGVQIAAIRLKYGLITADGMRAAELAVAAAELELAAHKRQVQCYLDQLRIFLNVETDWVLVLAPAPQPEPEEIKKFDLKQDTATAKKNSLAIGELKAERRLANSSGKKRIDLLITETENIIGLALARQYQTVLDAEKAFALAEASFLLADKKWQVEQALQTRGLLSAAALAAAKAAYQQAEAAYQQAGMQLFLEMAGYRAICDGLPPEALSAD